MNRSQILATLKCGRFRGLATHEQFFCKNARNLKQSSKELCSPGEHVHRSLLQTRSPLSTFLSTATTDSVPYGSSQGASELQAIYRHSAKLLYKRTVFFFWSLSSVGWLFGPWKSWCNPPKGIVHEREGALGRKKNTKRSRKMSRQK